MRPFQALALLLLPFAAACQDDDATKGSLTVIIAGLSGDALVEITGPAGFHTDLVATTTLELLTPGTYTITAAEVATPGTAVDTIREATIDSPSVTVRSGHTATATVTYATDARTGRLWIPGLANPFIASFTDGQLSDALTTTPDQTFPVRFPDDRDTLWPQHLAFAPDGTLWTTLLDAGNSNSNSGTQQLMAWSTTAWTPDVNATPSIVIDSVDTGGGVPSLDSPLALAFDGDGNLWVGNCGWITGTETLVRFAASALASSGAPMPDKQVTITGCPEGLSFDTAGNLWLLQNSLDLITMFSKGALDDASPAASATVHMSGAYNYPTASAFDHQGTLWVTQCGTFSGVTGYTAAQLAAAVDTDPAITLTSSAWSCPIGIAVDRGGNLWVMDNADPGGSLARVAASVLGASGAVTPAPLIALTAPDWSWGGLAFFPPGDALPIH
jgi:sugar lactone lactonase YvrE